MMIGEVNASWERSHSTCIVVYTPALRNFWCRTKPAYWKLCYWEAASAQCPKAVIVWWGNLVEMAQLECKDVAIRDGYNLFLNNVFPRLYTWNNFEHALIYLVVEAEWMHLFSEWNNFLPVEGLKRQTCCSLVEMCLKQLSRESLYGSRNTAPIFRFTASVTHYTIIFPGYFKETGLGQLPRRHFLVWMHLNTCK